MKQPGFNFEKLFLTPETPTINLKMDGWKVFFAFLPFKARPIFRIHGNWYIYLHLTIIYSYSDGQSLKT